MKVFLIAILSSIIGISTANVLGTLEKREHGLPYSSLPASSTCSQPTSCSNIGSNVTCHCNDVITICVNSSNQYCWGSKTLTSTTCPSVPTSCSSSLSGTESACLCNSNNVLCVDNANNYCYGSISGSTVSIVPLPVTTGPSSSSSSSSPTGVSTIDAPPGSTTSNSDNATSSNSNSNGSSGSNQITIPTFLTLACVVIAYMAN